MCLVLLALGLACAGASDGTVDETTGTSDDALSASARADAATDALFNHFWDGHYLRDAYPGDGKEAGYWIFAQAFDAMADAVQRTGGAKFKQHLATLYAAQDAHGWSREWFDDENWMALALIRAYDATQNHEYLNRAEWLFADIERDGRTTTGIWWDRAHTQKATASNFGPAITAARLNERTGKASYKIAAEEIYDYWYSTMVDRTTFQVADHRNANGTVDWRKFTYDTGLAIGASIELHQITGNEHYLSHAYGFGSYMIHEQVTPSTFGPILHDAGCTGDCDAFKGIGFRFLTKLYALDTHQTQYRTVLTASARAIWSSARNTHSNTFASDWSGPSHPHTSLAADASAVMSLNLAAEHSL